MFKYFWFGYITHTPQVKHVSTTYSASKLSKETFFFLPSDEFLSNDVIYEVILEKDSNGCGIIAQVSEGCICLNIVYKSMYAVMRILSWRLLQSVFLVLKWCTHKSNERLYSHYFQLEELFPD